MNNDFLMSIVDNILQPLLEKYLSPYSDLQFDTLVLQTRLYNLKTIQSEEKMSNNILGQHVIPSKSGQTLKLIAYFHPLKLVLSVLLIRPVRT